MLESPPGVLPGPSQPVAHDIAGGHLDRGGAGEGSKRRRGRESADVADPGEDLAGQQVADAVQLGQRTAAGLNSTGDLGSSRGNASIQPADFGDEVAGQGTQG